MVSRRGTYVLILSLPRTRVVQVGQLGPFEFGVGWYAYLGSAFGPGGLRGRLKHHLTPAARPHWHIDYLRRVAQPEQVWFSLEERRREHEWARLMQELPGAAPSVYGFGTSDCRCQTHLFRFFSRPSVRGLRQLVWTRFPGDEVVQKLSGLLPESPV